MDNECKSHIFFEKLMNIEIVTDALSEEWKFCVVQINDGNDSYHFLMKKGILL